MKARCLYVWFHVLNQTGAAYYHVGTGVLISVQLLTRTISSQVIKATLCTLRLASFHLTDACAHAICVQSHASLVRVCGSYLWPASLSKEPMVRRELEGFIHMGSGVFCASVLTSGSISEGEGVSFAPAMVLRLGGCYFQRSRESVFLLSVSEQADSFTDPQRRRLTHLPVSLVLCRGGGGALASLPHHGGRQTHSRSIGSWCRAILHPWLRNRGSVRLWGSRVVTITRQLLHQPDLQWDYIIVVKSSAFSSIDQKTVKYFEMIQRSQTVHFTFS